MPDRATTRAAIRAWLAEEQADRGTEGLQLQAAANYAFGNAITTGVFFRNSKPPMGAAVAGG